MGKPTPPRMRFWIQLLADPGQIFRQHKNREEAPVGQPSVRIDCKQSKLHSRHNVFSTEGGMVEECKRYHSRLAELVATKKGESYMTTMSWIRAEVSFALLRPALLCSRGSGVLVESIQNCQTWIQILKTDSRIFEKTIENVIIFSFFQFRKQVLKTKMEVIFLNSNEMKCF